MFIIILYASIFIGIVYGIFKLFYLISNSLLLIDETFINYVKNFNDNTIRKLINENDFEKEDDTKVDNHKRLNRHLRLDFLIWKSQRSFFEGLQFCKNKVREVQRSFFLSQP